MCAHMSEHTNTHKMHVFPPDKCIALQFKTGYYVVLHDFFFCVFNICRCRSRLARPRAFLWQHILPLYPTTCGVRNERDLCDRRRKKRQECLEKRGRGWCHCRGFQLAEGRCSGFLLISMLLSTVERRYKNGAFLYFRSALTWIFPK